MFYLYFEILARKCPSSHFEDTCLIRQVLWGRVLDRFQASISKYAENMLVFCTFLLKTCKKLQKNSENCRKYATCCWRFFSQKIVTTKKYNRPYGGFTSVFWTLFRDNLEIVPDMGLTFSEATFLPYFRFWATLAYLSRGVVLSRDAH